MDFEKFVKLMELTRSDNDNECLLAIRKANELLETTRKGWKQFLNKSVIEITKYVEVVKYVEVEKEKKEDESIGYRINYILDRIHTLNPSARDFIESINKTYIQRESVSERQALAIDKFYFNMRSRIF